MAKLDFYTIRDVLGFLDRLSAGGFNNVIINESDRAKFLNCIDKTVNDLANYYTKSETYTKTEVDNKLFYKFTYKVVSSLPTASADTMFLIYLIPATREGITQNIKKEYITILNGTEGNYTYSWEEIGDTDIDLTPYQTRAFSLTVDNTTYSTVEAILNALKVLSEATKSNVGTLDDLTTTQKATIVAAINELNSSDSTKQSKTLADPITVNGELKLTVEATLGALNDATATNKASIGTKGSLTTDAKTDLVTAINEVDAHIDSANALIGNETLVTTALTITGGVNELNDVKLNKTLSTPIEVDRNNKTTVEEALSAVNTLAGANKTNIGNLASLNTTDTTSVVSAINEVNSSKVDKVQGKLLTTEDFTTELKDKLNAIAEGAEVNVQADWNQTTTTEDDYIKNKPTLGTASALDVAASGNASATEVVKGDDTRLTDSRDPNAHTHTLSEVTDSGSAAAKEFTTYVNPGNVDLPTSNAVYLAMTSMLEGAFRPAGNKTVAELTSNLLVQANVGNVYKITDSGTTDTYWVGGAGQVIAANQMAVVVYGNEPNTFLFNLENGIDIDMSAYQTKVITSITVDGVQKTNVEDALSALNVLASNNKSSIAGIKDGSTIDSFGDVETELSNKVDKVAGRGLSTNDFSNEALTKLNDIEVGALVNVLADWNETVTTADSYIKNKPTSLSDFTDDLGSTPTHTHSQYITEHLDISGKADKADTYTKTEVDDSLATKVDKEQGKGLSANDYTTAEKEKLALLENYDDTDLRDTLALKANSADLATVATSGDYTDLTNTPTIPDELADLADDATHRTVTDTEKATWSDKQSKTLATAITIDGTSQTTVEGAIGAVNTLAANNKTAITAIKDGGSIDSFADVETALNDLDVDSVEEVSTLPTTPGKKVYNVRKAFTIGEFYTTYSSARNVSSNADFLAAIRDYGSPSGSVWEDDDEWGSRLYGTLTFASPLAVEAFTFGGVSFPAGNVASVTVRSGEWNSGAHDSLALNYSNGTSVSFSNLDRLLDCTARLIFTSDIGSVYSGATQLATMDDLKDGYGGLYFKSRTQEFVNTGTSVLYYKICSYLNDYPFIVKCTGQYYRATPFVSEVHAATNGSYVAYKHSEPIGGELATCGAYIIVDAYKVVWVAVTSNSRAKVELITSSGTSIDGSTGTPAQTYKLISYTATDGRIDTTVTSGSRRPVSSGAVANVLGAFAGASAASAGLQGSVPAPAKGLQRAVLRGDASWETDGIVRTIHLSYLTLTSGSDEEYSANGPYPNAWALCFSFVNNVSSAYTTTYALFAAVVGTSSKWMPAFGGTRSYDNAGYANKLYEIVPYQVTQRLVLRRNNEGHFTGRPIASDRSTTVLYLTSDMIRKFSDSVTNFGGLYHHSISLVLRSPAEYYADSGQNESFQNTEANQLDYYVGFQTLLSANNLTAYAYR